LWKIFREPILSTLRVLSHLNPALRWQEFRYVFVLAHVRSGSSLLAHVLASHPDFVGAGESNIPYRTPADFPMLILRTCWLLRQPVLHGKYIVDQINHDSKLTDEVLCSQLLHKCVILIRAPESALKSIMNLFSCEEGVALESYVNRLNTLARYGMLLRDRALLVEYDDLVDHTEEILAALTRFFGMERAFTSNYNTHHATGRAGDPSDNIRSGRIIRTKGHEYSISAETLNTASHAFRQCREQLLRSVVQARHSESNRLEKHIPPLTNASDPPDISVRGIRR
jgi:hypothetical protein